MNNIDRNEDDPTVEGIDVAPRATHTLSLSLSLLLQTPWATGSRIGFLSLGLE
jgi:hypothetical protein